MVAVTTPLESLFAWVIASPPPVEAANVTVSPLTKLLLASRSNPVRVAVLVPSWEMIALLLDTAIDVTAEVPVPGALDGWNDEPPPHPARKLADASAVTKNFANFISPPASIPG